MRIISASLLQALWFTIPWNDDKLQNHLVSSMLRHSTKKKNKQTKKSPHSIATSPLAIFGSYGLATYEGFCFWRLLPAVSQKNGGSKASEWLTQLFMQQDHQARGSWLRLINLSCDL